MMIEISGDFGAIVISAVRYALPRQTYMPSIVQEFVKQNVRHLSNNDLQVIIRDVTEAENGGIPFALGDEMIDRPDWLRFRDFLQEELNKREA